MDSPYEKLMTLIDWIIPAFIFIFGICWGSFLNVWIYRIPEKRSVAGGRSACMTCEHELNYLDLVPVFSFLFLGAKCRYCKTKLSWQYPAIELLVGLLFLLAYFVVGINIWLLVISAILITWNVVMSKIDWNIALIPNVLSYTGIVMGLIFLGLVQFDLVPNFKETLFYVYDVEAVLMASSLADGLIAAGVFFVIFFIMFLVNGMGMGDVKWAVFMGLFLGVKGMVIAVLIGTLLSSVFSLVVYGIILLTKKKGNLHNRKVSVKDEKDEAVTEKIFGISLMNGKPAIVLGPFLAIGMLIAWFFGVPFLDWWYI